MSLKTCCILVNKATSARTRLPNVSLKTVLRVSFNYNRAITNYLRYVKNVLLRFPKSIEIWYKFF